MRNKITIVGMIFILLFSLVIPATGQSKENIDEHWARQEINKWLQNGLATGYEDGSFRPNNYVTRAEFMAFVNRALGFTDEMESVTFKDVEPSAWYGSTVKQAIAANYIGGYEDGTLRPNQRISRQEVAVVLNRIIGLEKGSIGFQDSIPVWSKESVEAVAHAGLMKGYPDGTFKSEHPITRAEVIVTLDRVLTMDQVVYSKSGTYGPISGNEVIRGNVRITASDVTLQNVTITGDLTIAEEVGEGDVFLKGVIVQGDTHINGGGQNSVYFEDANLIRVFVNKKTGKIRVVVLGKSEVKLMVVESEALIESNSKSKIEEVIINSITEVLGEGIIEKAIININGVKFEKAPTETEVKEGVKEPRIGETDSKTSNSGEGSPVIGGGSGGGGSTPSYTVTFNSNGGSEIANATVTSGGTLTSPQAPTKAGNTFEGWYKDEALTEAFDFTTLITSNMMLYAKWQPNVYTLTTQVNDSSLGSVSVNVEGPYISNTQVVLTATAAANGTTFKGWTIDGALVSAENPYTYTMPAENKTIVANFIPDGYIPIATADELNNIRNATTETYGTGTLFEGTYTGGLDKNYLLVANIDLGNYSENEGWVPIDQFTGIFDGRGHTISNLTINRLQSNQGLFGRVISGTVKNVALTNINIVGGFNTGGLVSNNRGLIENCYVNGTVSGGFYSGGLVGENYGRISNSFVNASVIATSWGVGGIAGYNGGADISNSYVMGSVIGEQGGVGGIVGYTYEESSNQSTIQGTFAFLSDIIRPDGSTDTDFGRITSQLDSWDQNGTTYYPTVLENNYALNTLAEPFTNAFNEKGANNAKDGADLAETAAKSRQTYLDAGWSINEGDSEAIWDINEGVSYPYLKVLGTPEEMNLPNYHQQLLNNERDKITTAAIGELKNGENALTKAQNLVSNGYTVSIVSSSASNVIALDGAITGTDGVAITSEVVFRVSKDGVTAETAALTLTVAPHITQALVDAERDKITVEALGELWGADNVLTKAQNLVSQGYNVSIASSTNQNVIRTDGVVIGSSEIGTSEVVFTVTRDGITSNTNALSFQVGVYATYTITTTTADTLAVNFNTTVGNANQTWNVTGTQGSTVSATLSGDAKDLTVNVTNGAQTNESFTLEFTIGNKTDTVTFTWDGTNWTLSGNYLNRAPIVNYGWNGAPYSVYNNPFFDSNGQKRMTQNISSKYADPDGDTRTISVSTSNPTFLSASYSFGFLTVETVTLHGSAGQTVTVTLTIIDLKGGTVEDSFVVNF